MTRISPPTSFVFVSLLSLLSFMAPPALPATPARTPMQSEVACSGLYSMRAPRTEGYVISGDESADTLLFSEGDSVYLHMGKRRAGRPAGRVAAPVAARPGEEFLVIRPAKDPVQISWFRGQRKLEKRMGRLWEDVGRVRVIRIAGGRMNGKVAVARIENSCIPMKRGDDLVAMRPRPVPSLPVTPPKPVSGNLSRPAVGRVVSAKGFRQILGTGYVAYVDWGARQGAKPGDRLLLFRRPGAEGVKIDRAAGTNIRMPGFTSSSEPGAPRRLPKVILGQAVVLRASPTAATILVTSARRGIELGDYAALE